MLNEDNYYRELRDTVRRLAQQEVSPRAASYDEDHAFPSDIIPLFAEMGLIQIMVPEEYGGPGGDLKASCIVKEELARHSQVAAMLAGQNSIGLIIPLLSHGTEEQRQRFLTKAAAGKIITSFALTEPEYGSDAASIKTTAILDGRNYILRGQKTYISWGSHADYILVFARTGGPGSGARGISAFLLEAPVEGLRIGPDERKMGIKGVPNVSLFFDDVVVPVENRVGNEGDGFKVAMAGLNHNRTTVGAICLGLAEGALDLAVGYAKERQQFGRAIAEFQAIQLILANMATRVETTRALLAETLAAEGGAESRFALLAAMTKSYASDSAVEVTADAMQVFGGAGYMRSTGVERLYRDARVNQIFEGTNQIQRLFIARNLLR